MESTIVRRDSLFIIVGPRRVHVNGICFKNSFIHDVRINSELGTLIIEQKSGHKTTFVTNDDMLWEARRTILSAIRK